MMYPSLGTGKFQLAVPVIVKSVVIVQNCIYDNITETSTFTIRFHIVFVRCLSPV